MSITINTEVMERAGKELEEIASKLKHLESDVGALNASISNCFMHGGVGSRPSAAYSSLCSLTKNVGQRANALRVGAITYEETEERMSEHAQTTGSAIENGYNLDWVDRPDISDLLLAGGIIGAAGVAGAIVSKPSSTCPNFSGQYSGAGAEFIYGNHTLSMGAANGGVHAYATWQPAEGNIGVGIEAKGSASLLHYSYDGKYGDVDLRVGTIRGEAKSELRIMKDGHFDPKINVEGNARVEAISGSADMSLGSEKLGFDAEVNGVIGSAGADGSVTIDKTGIHGKGEIGAAAVTGNAKGTFKLFGLKIEASAKGELGAVGIGGEFGATQDSFTVGGKLSFLAGIGLRIKVSW